MKIFSREKVVSKPRVLVAMSGGVDSSVAAALLKKREFEVIGIFMKFWKEPGKNGENKCCSVSAQRDARQVAHKLNIPFYTIDAQKDFKKRVVAYFIKEYKAGRTPNPCVECNRWIKFGLLMDKAMAFGADYLATGHYVRLRREIGTSQSQITKYKLLRAKDGDKDQSYFLWRLNQKKLAKIFFPIGDYRKSEVRQMAKKFGLPIFEKKDSQEVCFINTDLRGFLRMRINSEEGPIITRDGERIGKHDGLIFYTIGQRRGISIGGTGPYYVIRKDFKNNVLLVSSSEKDLMQKEMVVKNVNWMIGEHYNGKCKVKIRSTAAMASASIKGNKIVFDKPQRAVAPGQSAVFYKGSEVLGGGVIC